MRRDPAGMVPEGVPIVLGLLSVIAGSVLVPAPRKDCTSQTQSPRQHTHEDS